MRSGTFEAELRTVLQVQSDLLSRMERSVDGLEDTFDESRVDATEISDLEAILTQLEARPELLEAGDFNDFDPEKVSKIYARNRLAVSSELERIGYRDWESFVQKTRALAFSQALDPLAPFDTLLDKADAKRLRAESYGASLRWDRWDYLFVFSSGILAALTDFMLVRIPRTISSGQYAGQKGSPLTKWMKQYDTTPGQSEGWFADWARELEKKCKVPYDRQHAVFEEELIRIPGMTGRSHRFQSLGHDPVLGFVFGVLDILKGTVTGFSYDNLTGVHNLVRGQVFSPIPASSVGEQAQRFIEAILTHIGHLVSDVATPMGLPAPFATLLQAFNFGSFGEKNRSVAEVARWMYLNGYDLRHFVVSGVTPAVVEIVLRAYVMLRHYSEKGEMKFRVADSPKYRSMLLAAHGVAATANAGKVALYQGNPLAINQAEWMAFMRYFLPHMKYWLFERNRLKLEHMERVNESAWEDLAINSGRLLERVSTNEPGLIRLGAPRTAEFKDDSVRRDEIT